MQKKKENTALPRVPEHYLYQAYQHHQKLKKPLLTAQGKLLEIVECGLRNPDNGPDFKDALLKIGGVLTRGDVEFHLCWQDWFRHGHNDDSRYKQVILHGLWQPPQDLPSTLSQRFPHLVISSFVSPDVPGWLAFMRRLADDRPEGKSMRVARRPSAAELRRLAWQRFLRKCEEARHRVETDGWDQALWLGLARSLGYSKNSAPFVELVRSFPPDCLAAAVQPLQRSPLLYWVLLCWHGGLFDRPLRRASDGQSVNAQRTVVRFRQQFQFRLPLNSLNLAQWHFSRLRPYNSPYVRLAGYSQLLFDYPGSSLFRQIHSVFSARLSLDRLLKNLQDILCLPLSRSFAPFFRELLDFGAFPEKTMGVQRCRQLALNILLPLFTLWAQMHHSPGFRLYLEDLWFRFPASDDNHILRLFSSSQPEPFAYNQQGLLEYYQQQSVPKSGESEKLFEKIPSYA